MFYQGFVEVFFDRGRERRNETQTEVLAAFAGVPYAFFRGVPRWQELFDKYCNPVGLSYSLYRGTISTCQQNCPSDLQIAQSDSASGVLRTNNIGSRPYDICGTP